MSLYFTHPEWLWCALAALAVAIIAHRRSLVDYSPARRRVILTSRLIITLALCCALAGLTLARVSKRTEMIALVDASASVSEEETARAREIVAKAETDGAADDVRAFLFASKAVSDNGEPLSRDLTDATDLESALFAAYAAADPTKETWIALFSDGLETTGEVDRALLNATLPVSVAPLRRAETPEVQASAVALPARARRGEPFKGAALVTSSVQTRGTLEIFGNGALLDRRDVELEPGENRFEFEATPGPNDRELDVSARINAEKDVFTDNNEAVAVVAVDGEPQVLAIAKDPDALRNFSAALRAQNINIQARPIDGLPSEVTELQKFDAVLLADVPATSLSLRQMETLRDYARDLGGGIVATGGENSFTVGGYARTPLDDIMPVKSEYEKEKEKPSVAIALVIDRSGSMDGEKLELTKDAAKGVVELLATQDFISVIAFDDAPREIVPLQNVLSPTVIKDTIGALSSGGSTNIYPALSKAVDDLSRVDAKFRHVILLTDGQSVPGDYDGALRRAASGNITVSAVGIGSDCDRFLLQKLATDGSGRYYQCDDAKTVPQIFARETRMADRSNLMETPFLAVDEPPARELLGNVSLEFAPPLLGAVVVQAKPSSEVALTTESGQPLLAFWRAGLGRVVAFVSDVDGRWSAEWLDWEEFPQFWAQTVRFAMRRQDARNAEISLEESGGQASFALDARTDGDDFLTDAQTSLTVLDDRGKRRTFDADEVAPGLYKAVFPVAPGSKYAVSATAEKNGETLLTVDRSFIARKSRESDVRAVDETALKHIAEATGGRYVERPRSASELRPEPGASGRRPARQSVPLRLPLLVFALLLYTADVFLRRGTFSRT